MLYLLCSILMPHAAYTLICQQHQYCLFQGQKSVQDLSYEVSLLAVTNMLARKDKHLQKEEETKTEENRKIHKFYNTLSMLRDALVNKVTMKELLVLVHCLLLFLKLTMASLDCSVVDKSVNCSCGDWYSSHEIFRVR